MKESVEQFPTATVESQPTQKSSVPKKRSLIPKNNYFFRGLFWGATFALAAIISATFGATLALFIPLSPTQQNSSSESTKNFGLGSLLPYHLARPVNILVMGIDRVPDAAKGSAEIFEGRSDTMLFIRFDPTNQSVRLLSIPRDSRVEIPGVGIAKINDANVEGGPVLAAEVVSETLNNVRIDRYVRVSTDAFRELVDLVGGIKVFVPFPMSYTDVTQSLEINLEPGWQTLDGKQAEQFSRFRNNKDGDIGRIQRQQILLKALRQRLLSPVVLARLPQIVRVMQQYIDTNLSLEEMLALVNFGQSLNKNDFQMVLLPGRFSDADEYVASYWIIDEERRDRLVSELFNQEQKLTQPTTPSEDNLQGMRIAVQNATTEPGLARSVANYLAQKNFYNVYIIKDSPMELRQTEIIVQQGDVEAAYALKKDLGLGTVEASSTGELDSDFTIRVGIDWLDKEIDHE